MGYRAFHLQVTSSNLAPLRSNKITRLLLSWVEECSPTSRALAASQRVLGSNALHTHPALRRGSNFCMQNVLPSQPQHISVEEEVEIHCPGCLFKFQHFHLLSWLTVPSPVLCTKLFYSRHFSYCFDFI